MIKKLIYILILFVFFINSAIAQTQNAYLNYNDSQYAFKSGDKQKFLTNAYVNMLLWEKAQTTEDKSFYQQEAMRYFYLLSKIDSKSIDAQIGLARIYDEYKLDKFAKEHFFIAYDFDNRNPKMNFHFANFYYKRNDLMNALFYYKRAHQYGFSKNYEVNYKLGVIYEKLADIESAKKFYANASKLKPQNQELINKIRLLDELKYDESQYYLKIDFNFREEKETG